MAHILEAYDIPEEWDKSDLEKILFEFQPHPLRYIQLEPGFFLIGFNSPSQAAMALEANLEVKLRPLYQASAMAQAVIQMFPSLLDPDTDGCDEENEGDDNDNDHDDVYPTNIIIKF